MTYNCDCECCYHKKNYDCLREKWCDLESDFHEGQFCCCCCCKKRKPVCKGRFGLAWISESSKNQRCICKPCGWQIEFEGTASKVDQTFNELSRWANNPPPPLFTKLNDNNCCCLVRDLNEFLTEENCTCPGRETSYDDSTRSKGKLVKKECGCECYLLTGKSDENNSLEMNGKNTDDDGRDKKNKNFKRNQQNKSGNDNDGNTNHHHNHDYDNLTPLEKIRKAHAVRDHVIHPTNDGVK